MNLKLTSIFFVVLVMLIVTEARAWEVDFSRRRQPTAQTTSQSTTDSPGTSSDAVSSGGHSAPTEIVTAPKDVALPPTKSYAKSLEGLVSHHSMSSSSSLDRQELVILNTGKGFVPNNVRLRQGVHYRIHVVNVNEDKKNVSFIMDAFNQHYATYYGQIKTFNLDPDKEGIFEFECPETSSSGKLVVFGPGNPTQERTVSSEK